MWARDAVVATLQRSAGAPTQAVGVRFGADIASKAWSGVCSAGIGSALLSQSVYIVCLLGGSGCALICLWFLVTAIHHSSLQRLDLGDGDWDGDQLL